MLGTETKIAVTQLCPALRVDECPFLHPELGGFNLVFTAPAQHFLLRISMEKYKTRTRFVGIFKAGLSFRFGGSGFCFRTGHVGRAGIQSQDHPTQMRDEHLISGNHIILSRAACTSCKFSLIIPIGT